MVLLSDLNISKTLLNKYKSHHFNYEKGQLCRFVEVEPLPKVLIEKVDLFFWVLIAVLKRFCDKISLVVVRVMTACDFQKKLSMKVYLLWIKQSFLNMKKVSATVLRHVFFVN